MSKRKWQGFRPALDAMTPKQCRESLKVLFGPRYTELIGPYHRAAPEKKCNWIQALCYKAAWEVEQETLDLTVAPE